MPQGSRIFRVFVSSTFSDLKAERNALQEQAFPRLRELCEAHGCRFQAIDLRWGVSEEAALDQQTMNICLSEIERCQKVSPRPNFIILLGDRYGWRPLPYAIPAEEFERLLPLVSIEEREKLLWHAEQPDSQRGWYRRDDNAVPAEYVLQPRQRGSRYEGYAAWESDVEKPLVAALERAARISGLNEAGLVKYTYSATGQEIASGALKVEDAPEHVFGFFRSITNPEVVRDSAANDFVESDPGLQQRQRGLKARLKERLRGNTYEYEAQWLASGLSAAHIGSLPQALNDCLKLNDSGNAPNNLCEAVWLRLSKVILAEIGKLESVDPLQLEQNAHHEFGRERATLFVGREEILAQIADTLTGNDSHPLVVWGASGSGKSALMGRAVQQAQVQLGSHAILIARFIGATPESSNGRALLESLCRQITRAYEGDESAIPLEYRELAQAFPKRLALARPDRPLVLFIDALDQLADDENDPSLVWLPADLPPHVKLVVSTLPGDCHAALQRRLPASSMLNVPALSKLSGARMLQGWLAEAQRTLTDEQQADILTKFERGGGLPLYLKLAYEEARHWHGYDGLPVQPSQAPGLCEDIAGVIRDFFRRLKQESNHGQVIVSHALGYLAAAKNGLSEDELLDVLSADGDVLSDFRRRSPRSPAADRLPAVIWSRLSFDLAPYLAERRVDGTSLLGFYHHQLREIVEADDLAGDTGRDRHRGLARYFGDQPLEQATVGSSVAAVSNLRKLAEEPYQLTLGELWDELFSTLTSFVFLERKARVGESRRSDAVGDARGAFAGPFQLQEDYGLALRAWPASAQAAEPSEVESRVSTLARKRQVLQAFGATLQREAHVLTNRPDLVWQQMYNRLRWETPPVGEALLQEVLQRGLGVEWTASKTWLRQTNRVTESTQLLRTLTAGQGKVNACRFNPKGKEILSAGEDGTLRLWDGKSGQLLAILGERSVEALCCAFSPNGQMMASGHLDGSLRLWSTTGYGLAAVIETGIGAIYACAFSQDAGKILVGGSDGFLALWDVAARKQLLQIASEGGEILCCDLSADAGRALSGSADGVLAMWNLEKEEAEAMVLGSYAAAYSCRFSQNEKWVVSAHSDGAVRLFDAVARRELQALTGHEDEVTTCDFSPDGQMIASGGMDGAVRIWNVSSGELILDLKGHTAWINSCSFDASSHYVVSGSADETLKIWDVTPRSTALSDDGHGAGIVCCAFSASGKWLATGSVDHTVRIWNAQNNRTVSVLRHNCPVACVSFSPDEKLLAAGGVDNMVHLWDWSAVQELGVFRGHVGDVNACLFTWDGKRVISASLDRTIRIWDTQNQRQIAKLTGHTAGVESCALNPDGNLLVSSSIDGTLKVWDLRGLSAIATLTGHTAPVMSCRFGPDGTKIVSASFDRTVKIWERRTGRVLHTLAGHTAGVKACVFSRDGKLVVSADWDKMIHVWDWAADTEIALYPALGNLLCCEFSPVEDAIAAGDEWGNLYLLRLVGNTHSPAY